MNETLLFFKIVSLDLFPVQGHLCWCNGSQSREANLHESHWVPHSFGLVPHQSKELRKLLLIPSAGCSVGYADSILTREARPTTAFV